MICYFGIDLLGLATEIGIAPRRLEYIQARGFLCHELLHLLGGSIKFVETPWGEFVLRIMEAISLPIPPICRWLPPQDCVLECVGSHSQSETRVYRLTPNEGAVVVFFVVYKPEAPIGGDYVRSAFNVPQLEMTKFLRPPFDASNGNRRIEERLRGGLVGRFLPPGVTLMTPEGVRALEEHHLAVCRGIWRGSAYPVGSPAYNILWVVGMCWPARQSSVRSAAMGVRRQLDRKTNPLRQ